jgi:hypothetical protein
VSNDKKQVKQERGEPLILAPLDFETALENMLQIKPIENAELKKNAPKKKSKPKAKK